MKKNINSVMIDDFYDFINISDLPGYKVERRVDCAPSFATEKNAIISKAI